ncbi:hypothetical protein BKA66DRAFT_404581 [Pyrenochaeta sp. MPI-SDFR-AT-0127]|nr:hypothetical protein BKA66DRAFT_404581 [Pyrenochaeta sp. MPI-SDFR-AT-0127]
MPKTRQTCTRCSQRRQKCDRKAPCTRCVQNSEGHLCTTKWVEGYDPSVHRKYPRKVSSTVSWPSAASSSETGSTLDASPSGPLSTNQPHSAGQGLSSHPLTPIADQNQTHGVSSWPPKIPDISIVALLSEKDQQAQQSLFNQRFTLAQSKGVLRDGPAIASYLSPGARSIEIQYVQSLLPSKTKVIQIVEYYEQYRLLYWTGGLYHGPSFRKKLLNAYGSSDTLDLQSLDWRWNALLFSILSSGIIGSSEAMSVSWGFGIDEKVRFAREWGAATVTCLNMGNFMSQYHINSVQAIYGLGLHRLGPHPDDNRILDLNQEQKEALIEREIGRRTWYAATSQEW